MNITEISSNSQIQLVLNKADLKELFLEWKEESELNRKKETETLLTPDEVASKYRISKVTLWRWAKDGLLKPVKMGRKSFYRQSDIERVFDLNNVVCLKSIRIHWMLHQRNCLLMFFVWKYSESSSNMLRYSSARRISLHLRCIVSWQLCVENM